MAQGDTNRVRTSFVEEDSLGVLPENPAGQKLRAVSPDFGFNKDSSDSDELRDDTRNAEVVDLGGQSAGTLGFEFSMVTFNKILEGLLGSTFSTPIDTTDTFTVTAAQKKIVAVGTPFTNAVKGQWLYFNAFDNSKNNGWKRIITKTSDSEIIVHDANLVDEAGATNVSVKGSMLRDGTTVKTYGIERSYLDLGVHELFEGARWNSWALNGVAKQKVTGNFGFVGLGVNADLDNAHFDSYADANTNPIVNAAFNLGSIMKDNVELTTAIQSIGLEYSRNLDAKNATRNAVPIGHRFGTQSGTGSLVAFFEDKALYQLFLNHTEFSLSHAYQDSNGKRIRITTDSTYFTSGGSPGVPGKNQDVLQNLSYMSKHNEAYNCQIQIDVVDS